MQSFIIRNNIILILLLGLLFGCSSGPSKYLVEPTPLKKGESKYYIENVNVELTPVVDEENNPNNFASEKNLKNNFQNILNRH